MNGISSNRSVFTARVQDFKQLGKHGKQAPPQETDAFSRAELKEYNRQVDTVARQMMGLIQSKEAVFHSDYQDGNPIVTVPDVGSLMLTADGFQMAILTSTVPFGGLLAHSLGSFVSRSSDTGTMVSLDKTVGELKVTNLKGEISQNTVRGESTSHGIRETMTLDTFRHKVTEHESHEIGYQFADAKFNVFHQRNEMANPKRPLFDLGR
jgi:hypothetical protein